MDYIYPQNGVFKHMNVCPQNQIYKYIYYLKNCNKQTKPIDREKHEITNRENTEKEEIT